MPIVETEQRFAGAFDAVNCPVCGLDQWVHLVYQGIFCDECNTRCRLREPAGDQGFIATFDGTSTWPTDDGEAIPDTEADGSRATGKWLGTATRGYERYWFRTAAERTDEYDGDWTPAWNRHEEADEPEA